MKKLRILLIAILLVINFAFAYLSECLCHGSFFIVNSLGLLILIIIIAFKENFFVINLTSKKNSHLQKLQSLGLLASSVAHDFNNHLTAIIGHSELLIDKLKDHEISCLDSIEEIKNSAVHGEQLVKQLLSAVRQRPANVFSNINVLSLVNEMKTLLNTAAGEKHKIKVQADSDKLVIFVDPFQLEQVIVNLVSNARDAMTKDGIITLDISSTKVTLEDNFAAYFKPKNSFTIPPGQYVQIKVSDTGTGIPKKILKKIFDPFFSTKAEHGTGLGLATVSQLINDLGGHILVDTAENVGTSFMLYFPQITETHPVERPATPNVIIEPTNQATVKTPTATILLVEDDSSVRLFAVHVLSHAGYRVLQATNVPEALNLFHDNKVDLLISDIDLGDSNGVDLAKSLLKIDPFLRIILTSGYTEDMLPTKIAIKDYYFLSKPYKLDSFIQQVQNFLEVNKK